MKIKGRCLARTFPSFQGPSRHSNYQHMFTQDMAQGIAPINLSRAADKKYQFKLVGRDSARAEAIVKQLAKYDSRRSHTELVCDAINNIASSLFYFGRCIYQITPGEEGAVTIHQAIPKRLISCCGYHVQLVPVADYKYFEKKVLLSTPANTWDVRLPPVFGGLIKFWITQYLLRFADEVAPRFATKNLMKNEIEFSVSKYSKVRILFVADIVKRYFWKQRSMANEHISEFYLVYRYLKAKKTKAQTRIYLLCELNKLLKKIGLDAEIQENGLPVPMDYERLLNDISSGTKPLKCFNELDAEL